MRERPRPRRRCPLCLTPVLADGPEPYFRGHSGAGKLAALFAVPDETTGPVVRALYACGVRAAASARRKGGAADKGSYDLLRSAQDSVADVGVGTQLSRTYDFTPFDWFDAPEFLQRMPNVAALAFRRRRRRGASAPCASVRGWPDRLALPVRGNASAVQAKLLMPDGRGPQRRALERELLVETARPRPS